MNKKLAKHHTANWMSNWKIRTQSIVSRDSSLINVLAKASSSKYNNNRNNKRMKVFVWTTLRIIHLKIIVLQLLILNYYRKSLPLKSLIETYIDKLTGGCLRSSPIYLYKDKILNALIGCSFTCGLGNIFTSLFYRCVKR